VEDLKSLAIGILGGLMVLGIAKAYVSYRNRSICSEIRNIELERDHLEAMKKSSVEMNRSSFKALFFLLMLIGIANILPTLTSRIEGELAKDLTYFIKLVVWGVFTALCYTCWKRYTNLKNYKSALEEFEKKLEKLNNKLQGS